MKNSKNLPHTCLLLNIFPLRLESHLQWKDSFNSSSSQGFTTLHNSSLSCLNQIHFHHFTCAQELLSLQTGRILTFTEHKSVTIPKSKRLQKGRWEDLVLLDWWSKLILTPLRALAWVWLFKKAWKAFSKFMARVEVMMGLLTPLKVLFWTGKKLRWHKKPKT